MKLEVGKFYVVREPKATEIIKVRVDVIRPEAEMGYIQVATTVFYHGGALGGKVEDIVEVLS